MDGELNTGIDTGEGGEAPAGEEREFSIEDSMREIATTRGDKLGSGEPDAPAPEPEVAPEPEAEPAPEVPPAPKPGERRPPDLEKAPDSWKPEMKGAWSTLPLEVRTEIHRREEDSARGVALVKDQASIGQRFNEVIKPFEQEFAQYNIDPYRHTQQLLWAHKTLALGTPEQKTQLFAQLAREYNIPLPKGAAGEASFGEPGWVDPEVKALQDKMSRLESERDQDIRSRQATEVARLTKQVEDFSKDTAHPYFEEVASEVVLLLNAQQGVKDLKKAYDTAVWANPTVREKLLAAQAEERQAAAKKAEEEAARKAAASRGFRPSASSKSASATGKQGTIEDTMKATMAEITARVK